MTLEEAIRHYEESEKMNKELAEICVSPLSKNHNLENAEKCRQMIEWLCELQERRKDDNEIPFGDSYSFTELDSIINAYEVHGGYHKKVVELLKELRGRRRQSEIVKLTDESAQIVPNENLISQKSAIDALNEQAVAMESWHERYQGERKGLLTAVNIISDLPSVQPEIILCKDCKYNVSSHKCLHPESFFLVPDDDFYCGYAERRTDD